MGKKSGQTAAVAESAEPAATATPAESPKTTLPFVPKIVKTVARPTLKLTVGEPIYVKFTSAIHEGKTIKAKEGETQRKPAQVADIIDLRTGEDMQLVCGAVIVSNIAESYEGEEYVGKCFMLVKNPKQDGKDYFTYKFAEIEDPTKAASK